MIRPSRDDVLMRMAEVVATRSTCSRLHVGTVISRDGRVLVTGYNGAAAGMPHCKHTPMDVNSGCEIAVHAEANAICFAARHGVAIDGAVMHSTDSPCLNCAKLIINAGVVEVHAAREYRIRDGVDLLIAARVQYIT